MKKTNFSIGLVVFFVICVSSAIASMYLMTRENPWMSISLPLLVSSIPYLLGVGILDEFEHPSKEIHRDAIRFPFLITFGSNPQKIPLDSYRFQLFGVILFIWGLFFGGTILAIDFFSSDTFSWSIHSPSPLYLLILSYTLGALLFSILVRIITYFSEQKRSKKTIRKNKDYGDK